MPYVGTGLGFGGFVATIKDSFTGDGSATNFTLSRNATSAFDLEVFVGNVRQEPSVAYTVSGTTLAFTGTPANGEVIYVVHQAGALTTQLPSSFLGVRDYTIGGNLNLNVDNSSAIKFGADQDVTLTHVADTGILLNSSRQLQFGDSGTHISQSADGVLDLVSDTEIEINATTIDINGNVEISGTLAQADAITMATDKKIIFRDTAIHISSTADGDLSIAADDEIDITSTLIDINGNLDVSGSFTLGGTALTSTATELNLLDGGTSTSSITIADANGFFVNDGGTSKLIPASDIKTYVGGSAADDLTIGDAAVLITTSSGNITIDAAANDSDIIFKGTDGGADKVFATFDGSAGGDLFLNGGLIDLKNDGSNVSQIKFYCESSNAHAQTLIGAPHAQSADNTLTLPDGADGVLLSTTSTATVTKQNINKSSYKHRYFWNIYSSSKCRWNNIGFCI